MRAETSRYVIAIGTSVLLLTGITGCSQPAPSGDSAKGTSAEGAAPAPTDLNIVAQVQIDENGAEVKAEGVVAPVDPAGDGTATCAPVTIAMAGALNVDPTRAGSISAAMGALSFATGALASSLAALFHDGTARPMALVMLAALVGSALALRFLALPRAAQP